MFAAPGAGNRSECQNFVEKMPATRATPRMTPHAETVTKLSQQRGVGDKPDQKERPRLD